MANIKISELPQLIFSSITNNDVIPIVDVNSNTTSKVLIGDLKSYFETTFTGGTVSGNTIFQNGLTANTISATTYENLPIDVFVTGGTYSAETITFTNNVGSTFIVSGISNNEWIETTVTVTNAQIDNCGFIPITLLPEPGPNKVYEYEITCVCPSGKINITPDNSLAIIGSTSFTGHFFYLGIVGSKSYHKWTSTSTPIYVVDAWFVAGSGYAENEPLVFTTATGNNPIGSALATDVVFNIKYKVVDLG